MSEVIREFIRRNPELGEEDAFERFLDTDRIRSWVGDSPARRERIYREFTRVWSLEKGGAQQLVEPEVQVRLRPRGADAPMPPAGSRRLNVMCPRCSRIDVWHKGQHIECRQCGSVYDDMLDLVPVKPVGPFAYLFGEGVAGAATATGIGLLLLLVYGVLRWA